jgi:hypothetical protein
MPGGGSKPGERRGGRQKGTPNKVTAEARQVFQAMFGRLAPKVETWIEATADNGDPAKAADLSLRLAEFHLPKRSSVHIDWKEADEEMVLEELKRREADG